MRKITKREDGRYMMGLPHKKGEPRRFVYGRTPDEVQRKYELATGTVRPRFRAGTIDHFVETHFAPWLNARVSEGTVAHYDNIWRRHLAPHVGPLAWHQVTPAVVERAITSLGSGSSQAMARSLLKQLFTLGIAHRVADPAMLSMLSTAKVMARKPKPRLNVGERADELLQNLEGHWVYGIVWTMATLGLRKGEACGLMASDLSADGVLTLQRQRDHRGTKDKLKARGIGEPRRIALPDALSARLRSFMAPEGYAFRDDAGEPVTYNHLDRVIEPFQPAERLTLHDLRSAAVSRLIDLGVDDRTIMDIVGHQDRAVMEGYRDKRDARTRAALERVVSGVVKEPESGSK